MARKRRLWKALQFHQGQIVSARDKSPWTVGEWREVPAPVRECEGLNCCESIIDAMKYVNIEVLAEVEIDGVRINGDDKITVQRMRIIRAWHWKREDSVLLAAFVVKLYLECLEKESLLDKAHSGEQIKSARAFIENPTYEKMLSVLSALFGGDWVMARMPVPSIGICVVLRRVSIGFLALGWPSQKSGRTSSRNRTGGLSSTRRIWRRCNAPDPHR